MQLSLFLVLLAAPLVCYGGLVEPPELFLPDISFESLSVGERTSAIGRPASRDRVSRRTKASVRIPGRSLSPTSSPGDLALYNHLATLGAVGVTNIPGYAEARTNALMAWERLGCSAEGLRFSLPDGTSRQTVAAPIHNGEVGAPLQFKPTDTSSFSSLHAECEAAMAPLRERVESASRVVFASLDKSIRSLRSSETGAKYGQPAMAGTERIYNTLEDIVQSGEGLEHIHTYSLSRSESDDGLKQQSAGQARVSSHTLPLHTDDGLFIAMTAGLYSVGGDTSKIAPPSQECGLYIQLSHGPVVKAEIDEDALIILVGHGGAHWLYSSSAASRAVEATESWPHSAHPVSVFPRFRALPHALVARESDVLQVRTWYGRMFLPPSDAILPSGLPYSSHRKTRAAPLSPSSSQFESSTSLLPLGCEDPDYLVAHPPASRTTSQFGGGRLDKVYVADGAQCIADDKTEGVYCWTVCVSTASLPCGQDAECVDISTNTSVDGTSMCPTAPHEDMCVVQCVSPDKKAEIQQTDFCTGTGVDMLMDGFTWASASNSTLCINLLFTSWTLDSKAKFTIACFGLIFLAVVIEMFSSFRLILFRHPRVAKLNPTAQRVLNAGVHGVHACLGYFLMLGAMTYSGELFLSLLLGLCLGYFLMHPPGKKPPASAEPCCQVYEDSDDDEDPKKVTGKDDNSTRLPITQEQKDEVAMAVDLPSTAPTSAASTSPPAASPPARRASRIQEGVEKSRRSSRQSVGGEAACCSNPQCEGPHAHTLPTLSTGNGAPPVAAHQLQSASSATSAATTENTEDNSRTPSEDSRGSHGSGSDDEGLVGTQTPPITVMHNNKPQK
eukprot:gb/GEZN01001415.1/.p1 GENE.gb/GEZN01001415.1/~~gb/GEZN01001415.1/.p1  ORF type:complete len:840 (+),score=88.51 gb/GEZN01001415.1/:53-2572(+)